jgi:hypothetical protein
VNTALPANAAIAIRHSINFVVVFFFIGGLLEKGVASTAVAYTTECGTWNYIDHYFTPLIRNGAPRPAPCVSLGLSPSSRLRNLPCPARIRVNEKFRLKRYEFGNLNASNSPE